MSHSISEWLRTHVGSDNLWWCDLMMKRLRFLEDRNIRITVTKYEDPNNLWGDIIRISKPFMETLHKAGLLSYSDVLDEMIEVSLGANNMRSTVPQRFSAVIGTLEMMIKYWDTVPSKEDWWYHLIAKVKENIYFCNRRPLQEFKSERQQTEYVERFRGILERVKELPTGDSHHKWASAPVSGIATVQSIRLDIRI